VEELDSEAFHGADVTVGMVLDMTNQYILEEGSSGMDACDELAFLNYGLHVSDEDEFEIPVGCEFFGAYDAADGIMKFKETFLNDRAALGMEPKWPGPTNKRDLIEMLKRGNQTNGDEWSYRTPNVDVMAMIINKVLKDNEHSLPDTLSKYLGEKILAAVGLDYDVLVTVDDAGDPNWGRGGSATARDMLRLGIMLLNDGKNYEGDEVLPSKAMSYIFDGTDDGDRERYVTGNAAGMMKYNRVSDFYDLYDGDCNDETCNNLGWSYKAYFRSFNPSGKKGGGEIAYMKGFEGQAVYVDRKANIVIGMMSEQADDVNWMMPFSALSKAFREVV